MIEVLKKKIEDSYYWDARVRALDCNYFGDEVTLVYEDGDAEIVYRFEKCYKVKMEQPFEYPRDIPAKELKVPQIPYFMQDVELNEITLGNEKYLEFQIDMYPMELYIVCKEFKICK